MTPTPNTLLVCIFEKLEAGVIILLATPAPALFGAKY